MNPDHEDEYFDILSSDLDKDVERESDISDLTHEVAKGVNQRTSQQKILFVAVCILVVVSFGFTVALVFLFGLGVLALPPSGQVAAIAAFGVQPFILVGILTTNVYRGSPIELGEKSASK